MIARHDVHRHGEWSQQFRKQRVFFCASIVHQIASDENQIRWCSQTHDVGHACSKQNRRINHTVGQLAVGLDVHVRNLRDQHSVLSENAFTRKPTACP